MSFPVGPCRSILHRQMLKVGDASSIRTGAEMTQYVELLLERVMSGHEVSAERLDGPVGPHLKWRYSSAYQKAVRRNDPSIQAVAAALNACDPAYIWRRAPTIALEDVSLGDPWVVALVLHACRFARIRARYGPDKLAGFLGQLMCRAVKDRLSCDSFCLPYFHPKLAHVRTAVDRMGVARRADLYRSDETPFSWRVAAGIALAGPRYGGGVFSGAGGSPERLSEVVAELAPYPIRWISRQYAKMARDGMFVTFPLVWRKLTSEAQVEVAQGQLPNRHLISGILSAAFDGHTSEGRRAISQFAKGCSAVAKLLDGIPNKQKVLELAVFTVDSSLLDRRLLSPWSEELYRKNLEGEVLASGISFLEFDAIASAILQHRDELNSSRSVAAK
jgi:hypothetical protein